MIYSGIPLIWGLATRMLDPYVYVVFWAPNKPCTQTVFLVEAPLGGVCRSEEPGRCCRHKSGHPPGLRRV